MSTVKQFSLIKDRWILFVQYEIELSLLTSVVHIYDNINDKTYRINNLLVSELSLITESNCFLSKATYMLGSRNKLVTLEFIYN
jgi:hypothetical protein